ncbi:MAG: ABC transporter permease [Synergistaceae bacterium]|jgi:ribose transport system permease protein|nr:ABC transporter permease [Synergistaceae bacterium]
MKNKNDTNSKGTIADVLKFLTSMREGVLLMVIVGLFIVMSFASKYFLTPQTMLNLLMSLTVEGIIAIGMLILLVSGGMDLSAGANMAFTGVLTGLVYKAGIPLVPAIVTGLAASLVIGIINGGLIAVLGLNPLITTLGMQMTLQGLMMMITRGKAVGVSANFQMIGKGTFLGIQYPVYILLILVIIFEILMRKSYAFRNSYYVGSNEGAARLNGINVTKVKICNYALTGLLSGLTGIVLAARLTTASVTVGGDTALRVITACIIGGATLTGGEGTVLGAFMGVVFIQLLSSSLNIMGVDVYVKIFVTGLILITAIVLEALNERRKATRAMAIIQKQIDKD